MACGQGESQGGAEGRAGCARQGRGAGGGNRSTTWPRGPRRRAWLGNGPARAPKAAASSSQGRSAHPACRVPAVGEGAGDARGECGRPLAAQVSLPGPLSPATVLGPRGIKPGKPRARGEGVGMWLPTVRAQGWVAKCRRAPSPPRGCVGAWRRRAHQAVPRLARCPPPSSSTSPSLFWVGCLRCGCRLV